MNPRRVVLPLFLLLIVISVSIYSINLAQREKVVHQLDTKIIAVGMTDGQKEGLQKEMQIAERQYGYIKKGNFYLERGETDKAIEMYEVAVREAYSNVTKGEAIRYLAGAYEKKRDYKKALELLQELSYTYVVSPDNKFRIPSEERLKYLKYASGGEFELAIKHAQLALEADAKLPTSTISRYQQRLNDLKASKEYIEGLKE